MWRSDRRVRNDVSNGGSRGVEPHRRVRSLVSSDGSCGCTTEESELFLAVMDRVDARQKSQNCF